ncbi:hypothetical protein PybrP1_010843 [[Pythium] brassicae (nom. inval.)]|nr:hypothetical protein PybrP1_010843 [[Pythium] brassicae (nom. inval.)]
MAEAPATREVVVPVHKKIAWLQALQKEEDSDDSDSSGVSVPLTATGGGDGDGPATQAAEAAPLVAQPAAKAKAFRDRKKQKKRKKKAVVSSSSSSDSESEGDRKAQTARKKKATNKRPADRKRKPAASASSSSSSSSSASSESESHAATRDQEKRKRTPTHKAAVQIAVKRKREVSAKERNDPFASADAKPSGAGDAKGAEQKHVHHLLDAKRIKLRVSKDAESGEVAFKVVKQQQRPSSVGRKRPLPGTTTPRNEEKKNERPSSEGAAPAAAKAKKQLTAQEKEDWKLAIALDNQERGRGTRRRTASEDTLDGVQKTGPAAAEKREKKQPAPFTDGSIGDSLTQLMGKHKSRRGSDASSDAVALSSDAKVRAETPRPAKKFRRVSDESGAVPLATEPSKAKSETPRPVTKSRKSSEGAATPRAAETTPRPLVRVKGKAAASPVRVLKLNDAIHAREVDEKRKTPRDAAGARAGARDSARVAVGKRELSAVAGGVLGEPLRRVKQHAEGDGRGERLLKVKRATGDSVDASSLAAKTEAREKKKENGGKSAQQQQVRRPKSVREDASAVLKASGEVGATEVKASSTDGAQQPEEQAKRSPDAASSTTVADAQDASAQDAATEVHAEAPAAPAKPSVEAADEKEEGEEEDGEAEPSKPVVARATASDKAAESAAAPDLLSFVIPKKKFVRTESQAPSRAAVASALPPSGNASLRRTPASSPLPREPEANGGSAGNNQTLVAERAPVRRRRRTKNPVPVAATALSRDEVSFMRLARKVNSFYAASEKLLVPQLPAGVGRYDVVGEDGKLVAGLPARMKCPTKKQLKTQKELYPAPYFGVAMTLPSATNNTEAGADVDNVDRARTHSASAILDTEISSYEPLAFERIDDREVYQRKMYGTTFVPQLLRVRTTLIMRNVRYERKSTGFQFNTDRDRDDFAKELGERYTMNKSVPRGDIPPKNWQQLLKKQPAVVYLHYANSEDAELAAQQFVDDHGAPLERKRTNRVGGAITSTPSSPALVPLQAAPRRSRSIERSAPASSPVFPKTGDFARDRKDDAGRGDSAGAARDMRPEPDGDSFSRDSSQPEAGNWQPYHDERRAHDRPGGWHGGRTSGDFGQGPRDWPPPRSQGRGGGSHPGDARDRRSERFGGNRGGGGRFSTQRYGPGLGPGPGPGPAATQSNGAEQRDRDDRPRRSRSPAQPQPTAPPPQAAEEEAFDSTYWPSGKSDDEERRDGESSDKPEPQTASSTANAAEEPSKSQATQPTSHHHRDEQLHDEPAHHSQEDSQRSSRSPDRAKQDDRSRDGARSGSGDRADGDRTTSEPRQQQSQAVGELGANPDGHTGASEQGEVVEDNREESETRGRAGCRSDELPRESERAHEPRRDFDNEQRPHRVEGYDSRRRDDEFYRPNNSQGGGFDDRALDERDRHFRGQEFGNRGTFPRRRSRSRSQPRDDRERGGTRGFDGGRRERDFGRGRDIGYFDSGRGGGGGYDASNGFDSRYHQHHQQHHHHHYQQPQPPPPHHHHPDHEERERPFQRNGDGEGYRPRPRSRPF